MPGRMRPLPVTSRTLATTWVTSVEQLSPESRCLLGRLAFLAPDPVPDSLLEVAAPRDAPGADADAARAGLYAYSLITRVRGEDGGVPGFVIHRLVQDFARRAMTEERRSEALQEALGWVNSAFLGDALDARSWPVLDPLAQHALAVARAADEAGIAEPTAWLFNQLGLLFWAKARYAEAEPLMRRALEIGEESLGPDQVAADLNNLAQLLQATGRLGEAEPLIRRALAIDEASSGPDHPSVAVGLNNLAILLQSTDCLDEAEPLILRALAIDEASYGAHHPCVAIRLTTLASLLYTKNRLTEAEPLMRRALAIDEGSYGPNHPKRGRRSQQSREPALRHEPARQGGAAHSPRARHRRGEPQPKPSQGRDPPQQSREIAKGHEPAHRGGAAISPRAGDLRTARGQTIPRWRSASTTSRTCFTRRTALPRPSR